MTKKTANPKVTFKGVKPDGGILKAKIPTTVVGPKISFPHRYMAVVDTGLEVTCPKGYKLGMALVPHLATHGMIATNLAAGVTEGKVTVVLLNVGREIVEVKDGDPLVKVWLEVDHEFDWEESK
jgi:dUTPase